MRKIKKKLLVFAGVTAFVYLLLLIPDSDKHSFNAAGSKAFSWNKDLLWSQLETKFTTAKLESKPTLDSGIQALFAAGEKSFNNISLPGIATTNTNFNVL